MNKYESLWHSLEDNKLAELEVIKALKRDLDSVRMAFKTDQSIVRYYAMLINLEVLAQGSIGTANGSEKLSSKNINLVKALLQNNLEGYDHQLAYIFYLAHHLSLVNTAELTNLIVFINASDCTATQRGLVENLLKKKVEEKLKTEKSPDKILQLQNLMTCCDNFGVQDFNPLDLKSPKQKSGTFQRFVFELEPSCHQYQSIIRQFEDNTFLERLPEDMKGTMIEITQLAHQFFENPKTFSHNKTACSHLMNSLHALAKEVADIRNPPKNVLGQSVGEGDLHRLLNEAERINKKIDEFKAVAPSEVDWAKCFAYSLKTVLVGIVFWILPSLAFMGRNSFFRRSLATKATDLVNTIKTDLDTRIKDIEQDKTADQPPSSQHMFGGQQVF